MFCVRIYPGNCGQIPVGEKEKHKKDNKMWPCLSPCDRLFKTEKIEIQEYSGQQRNRLYKITVLPPDHVHRNWHCHNARNTKNIKCQKLIYRPVAFRMKKYQYSQKNTLQNS